MARTGIGVTVLYLYGNICPPGVLSSIGVPPLLPKNRPSGLICVTHRLFLSCFGHSLDPFRTIWVWQMHDAEVGDLSKAIVLDVVNEMKLLGVIITDDLKWHKNTENITNKAYKRL